MAGLIRLHNQFLLRKDIQDMIDRTLEEGKRKASKETTTKQQILILHYLGFFDKIDTDTTRKAEFLSRLLNRHEQNIRTHLTYVDTTRIQESDIKTPENLKAVRKIFEDSGLRKEISLIDKDLKKLGITE